MSSEEVIPVGKAPPAEAPQELPAIQSHLEPISEAERERGLRYWVIQKFANMLSVVPGTITTEFFTRLGFNAYHFGLLASLTTWTAQPINWAAAVYFERTGKRKTATVRSSAMTVATTLGLMLPALWCAIPALGPIPSSIAVPLLIVLSLLGAAAMNILGTSIIPWMRDLSGPERWAGFFAGRMTIARLTIPLGLVFALFIWIGRRSGDVGLNLAFAGCFLLAAAFCALCTWAMAKSPDPRVTIRTPGVPMPSIFAQLSSVLIGIARSRPLRRYLLFSILQFCGIMCQYTFVNFYMVNVIKLSQMEMIFASTVLLAILGMGAAKLYVVMKHRIDDRGWACLGLAVWTLVSLFWVMAVQWRWLYLVLVPLFEAGNLWVMFGANNGILIRIVPGARRTMYMTAVNFISGLLSAAIPPLLGKWMALHVDPATNNPLPVLNLCGMDLLPIQIAMLLGAAFYLLALLTTWKLLIDHDPTVKMD